MRAVATKSGVWRVVVLICNLLMMGRLASAQVAIQGFVRNANGDPLSGVNVQVVNSGGTTVGNAATNGSGAFTTAAFATGASYFLRTTNASLQGYLDQVYQGINCTPGCPSATTGTAVPLVAAQPSPQVNFALIQPTRISGTITNSGGTPISGITVRVFNSSNSQVTTAVSNGSGVYNTGTLAPGTYFLVTQSGPFADELYDNLPCSGVSSTSCTATAGTPVLVLADHTSIANFSLSAAGVISGTVTDAATSAPLSGVQVQIFSSTGVSLTPNPPPTTNAAGVFSTALSGVGGLGLNTGSYYVRTSNFQGYIDQTNGGAICIPSCTPPAVGTPVAVTAGATTTVNFPLAKGAQITGRVTDASNGAGVPNFSVQIFDAANRQVATSTTNTVAPVGNYATTGLTPGTYFVRTAVSIPTNFVAKLYDDVLCTPSCNVIGQGTPIVLTAGAVASNINLALTHGGHISGTIRDSVTLLPIQGIGIGLVTESGASAGVINSTNNLGAYTMPAVPAGTYFARTNANAGTPSAALGYIREVYNNIDCSACNPLLGTPIVVTQDATTTGIDFSLTRGARLSGHVQDADTGNPIGGVTINVFGDTGLSATAGGLAITTNAAGDYLSADGLKEGPYYVKTSNTAGYINEKYNDLPCNGNCIATSGTAIDVPASGFATANIDLRRGGRVSGTLTDADTNAPISGTLVFVVDTSGVVVASSNTDAAGVYNSPGVATGSYYVRTLNANGYINKVHATPVDKVCLVSPVQDYPSGCDSTTIGTLINVTEGSTVSGIDFSLQRGGRASGTVTTTGGTPLEGVTIEMYGDPTKPYVASAITTRTGSFTTRAGAPSGNYTIRTQNTLGYLNERFNELPCLSDCSPAGGTAISIVSPSTTSGVNFTLDPDGDGDGDGILSSVDTSAAASNDFSDVAQGGTTTGTIAARGGWTVAVSDVSPGGVVATLGPTGTTAALLQTCALNGNEEVALDAAAESARILCDPNEGSTNVKALVTSGAIELRKTVNGVVTEVQLGASQGATIGSPVIADTDNTEALVIDLLDAIHNNAPLGTFDLGPGESAEAVKVDDAGTIAIKVYEGTVTATIGDAPPATLTAGQVAVVPPGGEVQVCSTFAFTDLTVSPDSIKASNHKMVNVTLSPTFSGACGVANFKIVSIGSNEPVNGLGDGDTAPDWLINGPLTAQVRGERSGAGNGRVYTVTVEGTDGFTTLTKTTTVTIPK